MQYTRITFASALLAASLAGQGTESVTIDTKSSSDKAMRYTIQAEFETSTSREMLINGEEPDFGGFGGGGGGGGFGGASESSSSQEVVFEQGPKGANWRQYDTVESLDTRQGRDGEPVENTVEGALAGKRVRVARDEDGETTLIEGEGADGKVLPANLGRHVTQRVDLSGFVPSGEVAVGSEFELANFRAALQGVVHPVAADRPRGRRFGGEEGDTGRRGRRGGGEGGEGGNRRGGGEGEEGGNRRGGGEGEEGGNRRGGGEGQEGRGRRSRGEGQEGGGRRGSFRRSRGGSSDTAVQLVHNDALPCKATGVLVAIEEVDGRRMAKIKLKATIAGKGEAEELGIQSGLFGSRGGRGGRGGGRGGFGGGDSGTTTADVNVKLAGEAWVDLERQLITSVSLRGTVDYETMTERIMDREGEEMVFEMNNFTEGSLVVKVACAMTQGN